MLHLLFDSALWVTSNGTLRVSQKTIIFVFALKTHQDAFVSTHKWKANRS